MYPPISRRRAVVILFTWFASVVAVFAQTAPAANDKGETIVTLTPFEVSSTANVGYQATDTLAGSRLNTSLKDTAASISVFTEELIRDLGAFDLDDVLKFANNLQPELSDSGTFGDTPGGNFEIEFNSRYRIRGIIAQVARNYFKWQNPTDTYNVGRVEDSRGPNSVLFGIGSAGGIVNVATKQAELKRTLRAVSLAAGNDGTWRATLDLNQPLGDKGAIRFNALANDTRYMQYHRYNKSQRAHVAAKYRFTPRLMATVEFEIGDVEINSGRATGVFDTVLPWLNAGRPVFQRTDPTSAFTGLGSRLGNNQLRYIANSNQLINMAGQIATTGSTGPIMDPSIASYKINSGGPGQYRKNPFNSVSAAVVAELPWNKTFVEVGVNRQEYDYESFDPIFSHQLYGDANATLPGDLGANPYARQIYMETNWRAFGRNSVTEAVRATISTELDVGKWGKFRFAAMGEYEKEDQFAYAEYELYDDAPFHATPENGANWVRRRSYVTEGDWSTYYVNSAHDTGLLNNVLDPITGRTLSSSFTRYFENHDPVTQTGGLLSVQGGWFGGKLVAGAGYRADRMTVLDRGTMRNPTTNIVQMNYDSGVKSAFSGTTNTLGVVWHATKRISVLYNRSRNMDIPPRNAQIPPGYTPPPPAGQGYDVGLAFTLLEGKLYARAVHYMTRTKGLITTGAATYVTDHNLILSTLLTNNLITQAEHDARRGAGGSVTRGRQSDGYEFSLTANPTPNWRMVVNYSFTDGMENNILPEMVSWWGQAREFFLKFPQDLPTGVGANTIATEMKENDDRLADARSVEGIGMVGNREHKVNFFTRYTFREGFLKDSFIGGGYRYQGEMLVGRTLDGTDRLQYGPPYGEANLLLGRDVRLKNGMRLNVQLNINNLFDETDPIPTRYFSTGNTTQVRRLIIREGRTWRLSSNLWF